MFVYNTLKHCLILKTLRSNKTTKYNKFEKISCFLFLSQTLVLRGVRDLSNSERLLDIKGAVSATPLFCLHLGTLLTKFLEINTKKYLVTKTNS